MNNRVKCIKSPYADNMTCKDKPCRIIEKTLVVKIEKELKEM